MVVTLSNGFKMSRKVEFLPVHQRPSKDDYFLLMARVASLRATCSRRAVGCVLVDKHGHALATGYNGVAAGLPHCIDNPCPGAGLPSGSGLSACEALHAEENALIQLRDTSALHTVYCTASPCILCTRRLLNTSAVRIVFEEEYPHPEAKALWVSQGREWVQGSKTIVGV
jgi:dCMP deaminase